MNNANITEKLVLELQRNTSQDSERIIKEYYDKLYNIEQNDLCSCYGHNHYHKCDFEMLHNKKQALLLCKKYLRTKHMKRDKQMECCDNADCNGCRHMKHILLDQNDTVIACY